jgi:proline racemase
VHAEGEVGRVITGGIVDIPGSSMIEKMAYINEVDDSILRFCLFEPRGSAQMSCNLLLPASRPEANAGFIVMQPDGCHAMSGSNAMCVATVLLETGIVLMKEPETELVLDTPAGLVEVTASCRNGKVESVSLEMPSSFVEHLNHPVRLDDGNTIEVDVAYGGAYYAIVNANDFGIGILPEDVLRMVELAQQIKIAANKQIVVRHPTLAPLDRIEYVMFATPLDRRNLTMRGGTVIYPGRLDRSPCGTGTSARLAVLHAKGEIAQGETVTQYSVINSRFDAAILKECTVGDRPAVVPRISGRAWIYAVHQLGVDPTDPYKDGYILADTWGPEAEFRSREPAR